MKLPVVKLSDIAAIAMGQSPPGTSYNETGDGIPLFQGKAEFGETHPIPVKWCTQPTRIAESGDILLSVRAPVGPTNIANQRCCIGRGLTAIQAREQLTKQKYLYFFFKYIEPSLSRQGQGSTFAAINRSEIESILVPLPPLSEQRRIVEILEQADALRKKRAEADAKAERILPALFIKMFGEPSEWLSTANTKPLRSLVNVQGGGTPSKKNPEYWKGNIPWVSPKDMKQDILFDATDHISDLAIEETSVNYINPGAVLIVVRGMILAHTIPIALAGTRLTINQDMKALQPNCDDIDSTYLYAALKASSSALLSQVGTAGHGTRKLDTDALLQTPILIPPRSKLDAFRKEMMLCREVVSSISKTKVQIEKLFDLLLQRAFSGALTAKWREAHITDILTEMEQQAKILGITAELDYEQPAFTETHINSTRM